MITPEEVVTYYFYTLEFNDGVEEWELKDVTVDKNDFSKESLYNNFDTDITVVLKSYYEIPEEDFNVLRRYL